MLWFAGPMGAGGVSEDEEKCEGCGDLECGGIGGGGQVIVGERNVRRSERGAVVIGPCGLLAEEMVASGVLQWMT